MVFFIAGVWTGHDLARSVRLAPQGFLPPALLTAENLVLFNRLPNGEAGIRCLEGPGHVCDSESI
jgi:hypothetical protein